MIFSNLSTLTCLMGIITETHCPLNLISTILFKQISQMFVFWHFYQYITDSEEIRYGNQLRECPPLTLITATHLLYIEWMRLKSWLFCVVVWQNLYWLVKRRSTIILRVFFCLFFFVLGLPRLELDCILYLKYYVVSDWTNVYSDWTNVYRFRM